MYSEWNLTQYYRKDPKSRFLKNFFVRQGKWTTAYECTPSDIWRSISEKTQISIFGGFFRKTRKMNNSVRMHSEWNLTQYHRKDPKSRFLKNFFVRQGKWTTAYECTPSDIWPSVTAKTQKSRFLKDFFVRQGKWTTAYCRYSERNLTQYYGKRLKNQVLISLTISLYVTTTIRSISKIKPMAWT